MSREPGEPKKSTATASSVILKKRGGWGNVSSITPNDQNDRKGLGI